MLAKQINRDHIDIQVMLNKSVAVVQNDINNVNGQDNVDPSQELKLETSINIVLNSLRLVFTAHFKVV